MVLRYNVNNAVDMYKLNNFILHQHSEYTTPFDALLEDLRPYTMEIQWVEEPGGEDMELNIHCYNDWATKSNPELAERVDKWIKEGLAMTIDEWRDK